MFRALLRLATLAALVLIGGVSVSFYLHHTALDRQLAEALDQNQQLRQAVDRLTAERRVAEVLVTDRSTGPDGVPRTTVLVEEYARRRPAAARRPGSPCSAPRSTWTRP